MASTLTLKEVTVGNPFADYPQLRTIWPHEFSVIAEEAAEEATAHRPFEDIGGLYLVMRNDEVIGITGYFYVREVNEPFLRWHGIVPAQRGNGYSRVAMDLLVARIKANLPEAAGLTELVPDSNEGPSILHHFSALGFVVHGAPERYDWSAYTWQPVRLNIGARSPRHSSARPPYTGNDQIIPTKNHSRCGPAA